MKTWLEINDIEMYSTHNKGKSVVAERFIGTLKNEIYKYMTSTSKMCILINQNIQVINITMNSTVQLKLNLLM